MRTPEGDNIFRVIRRHSGRENAISARCICRELDWPETRERHVRRIISDESHFWVVDHDTPFLVCAFSGSGNTGYFVAQTFEEAELYENWLSRLASVANLKLFNFRQACSRMGIKLRQAKAA